MREYSVNGVMQEGLVRRLQGRPHGDPLPPPGRRRRAGGAMPTSGAAGRHSEPNGGRTPLGGPGRRALPAMIVGLAVGLAAIAGLALSGADAAAAGCAVVLGLGALAVGWGFGERGMASLEAEVETSTSELKRALSELEIAQAETVQRLSMAVEFRDEDTGAHIERIGRFSVLLAEHIGMDADFCERLRHAAPLHDVGKVAIPDAILLKPGPLTPEERAIVETHAEEGHRLVRGSSSSILDMAATIALSHQEKWDGSGYPRGLKGEAIPIEGRIVAVADVFDALTSDRVYRKAFSVDEAIADDARTARSPLRPGAARRVHGSARPLRARRPRGAPPRPRSARRVHARDVCHRARTRRRRDGRGRDRDRDRGRHHADHAPRRGDRPVAAPARRALGRRRTVGRHASTARRRSCAACWRRCTAT